MERPRSILFKKVLLTDDEYKEYQLICKRYTQGEELFRNIFEVDDNGRIVYIKSVADKEMSFEVIHYLQNTMLNSWLRYSVSLVENKVAELDVKLLELTNKIALLDNKISGQG